MKDFIYANELKQFSQNRYLKRIKIYDSIIEKIQIRIKIIASNNLNNFIYEVPEFIPGYPIYNIEQCCNYIIQKLKEHDFIVSYKSPNILYISWNIKPSSKNIKIKNK